jgi:hypothetical protein
MASDTFDWDARLRAIKKQYDVHKLTDNEIILNDRLGAFPGRACQEMILKDVRRRWPETADLADASILQNFNLGAFPPQHEQEEFIRRRLLAEKIAE